jgi:hypothetical protein
VASTPPDDDDPTGVREPDPGTNVSMPAVADDQPPDATGPTESGSIDVQFSTPGMPTATLQPPRKRPRSKTVPGMLQESLSHIPVVKEVMPKTRKGQVLFRSVVVAFSLVAVWIGVIVYLQLRSGEKPDFRPEVEAIFVKLRDGAAAEVYEQSSTRFQEIVAEEGFLAMVQDMNESLGPFIEVASVIDTDVFRGASGRTSKVDLLLEFENGRARASMSFHQEDGIWKMVGFHVDLPEGLQAQATSEESRAKRVQAPEVIEELTQQILVDSRDGKAGAIWDAAAQVFKDSISREEFIALEQERRETLGPFLRIFKVTSSRQNPAQTGASLDALLEFRNPQGGAFIVTASFKYAKIDGVWKLTFFKLIMPMPRGPGD